MNQTALEFSVCCERVAGGPRMNIDAVAMAVMELSHNKSICRRERLVRRKKADIQNDTRKITRFDSARTTNIQKCSGE